MARVGSDRLKQSARSIDDMERALSSGNQTARNDRRRLTANFINTIAAALVITGSVVPVISLTYSLATPQTRYWPVFLLSWLTVGIAMHMIARRVLSGVEE